MGFFVQLLVYCIIRAVKGTSYVDLRCILVYVEMVLCCLVFSASSSGELVCSSLAPRLVELGFGSFLL